MSVTQPIMPFAFPPILAAAGLCPQARLAKSLMLKWLLVAALAVPALAAEREVTLSAPPTVAAGTEVSVAISVATHVGGGEQIGFVHSEYSTDGGKTWSSFCYEQNKGTEMVREAPIHAGAAGSRIIVRLRVAFRDGAAGDVDFTGAAIQWADSWQNWAEPPAKSVKVSVVAP